MPVRAEAESEGGSSFAERVSPRIGGEPAAAMLRHYGLVASAALSCLIETPARARRVSDFAVGALRPGDIDFHVPPGTSSPKDRA
jgi:hypothetical protein